MDLARQYNSIIGYKEKIYRKTIFPGQLPDKVLDEMIKNSVTCTKGMLLTEVRLNDASLRNKPRFRFGIGYGRPGKAGHIEAKEGYLVLFPVFSIAIINEKGSIYRPPAGYSIELGALRGMYRPFVLSKAGYKIMPSDCLINILIHYVGFTKKRRPSIYCEDIPGINRIASGETDLLTNVPLF